MEVTAGTRLSHYQIREPLGKGGMGEVYLADDTQLDRRVALKILPSSLASDEERMKRFAQEARTTSGLNHPNILTVYEIGEVAGTKFMACEFVDGITLRQIIQDPGLTISLKLDVAIQICSALAVAHAAGVVHRDIKPENIMVRTDGYVKVLDFGLAKLTESSPKPSDPEARTEPLINTDAGVVMGTVSYMSPEQARGLEVDSRTDIWSSGAVLYETLTGRVAFEGSTKSDVVASILERDPAPISRDVPGVPEELERIISKSLAKDREERYQTIKDLLVDLRRLKRSLEKNAERERAWKIDTDSAAEGGSRPVLPENRSLRPELTGEYFLRQLKKYKGLALSVLIVLIVATAIVVYFTRKSSSIDSLAVLPFLTGGSDPDMEFIGSGISEDIINNFARVPSIRVVPQSMVSRFKGQEVDSVKVGKELGVGAILTGQVIKRGDALILKVDLVDVTNQKELLVKGYSRTSSDALGGTAILAMQEDISKQVFEELRSKLITEH